jgi:hypothetical protein
MFCSPERTLAEGADDKPKEDVRLTGGLSASVVTKNKDVKFWITIDNRSDFDLSNVDVKLNVDENEFACKLNSGVCVAKPGTIAKGQSITLQGNLTCLASTEPSNISADVLFTTKIGQSERAVSLGPLAGRYWYEIFFSEYKELVLPIVITLLGFYLTSSQSSREKKQAQLSETWTSMLPITHKLTMRSYLPMLSPLMRFFTDIDQCKSTPAAAFDASDTEQHSIFFHLMCFWWRMNETQEKQGAIIFKNRVGEDIVLNAFQIFRSIYKSSAGSRFDIEERVKLLQKSFNTKLEFPDFEEKVVLSKGAPATSPLRDATLKNWNDYCQWYADAAKREQSVKLLRVFLKVMAFECNRPYQHWYNVVGDLDLDGKDEKAIMSLTTDKLESKRFKNYIKKAKTKRWESV